VYFEGDCFIGHSYSAKLKLLKQSEGSVNYKMRMEGKSSSSLEVELKTEESEVLKENNVLAGEMTKDMELQVTLVATECGTHSAFFYVEIEDGPPISFSCEATFRGPIVRLVEPVVDFGLVKVNSTQKFRVNLENTSPIPAEILIKNSK